MFTRIRLPSIAMAARVSSRSFWNFGPSATTHVAPLRAGFRRARETVTRLRSLPTFKSGLLVASTFAVVAGTDVGAIKPVQKTESQNSDVAIVAEIEKFLQDPIGSSKRGLVFLRREWETSNKVIPLIVVANLAVYVAWQVKGRQSLFMNKHFTLSLDGLLQGRFHTLLTSVFSQHNILHLGFNMLALSSIGTIVYDEIGMSSFLSVYAVGGIVGSLASVAFRSFTRDLYGRSLGASGAIMTLLVIFAEIFPERKLATLFGTVSAREMELYGVWAFNLVGLVFIRWLFDFAGHLGGATVGRAYCWIYKPRAKERRLLTRAVKPR